MKFTPMCRRFVAFPYQLIIKQMNDFKNRYTCFFENQATKTYQSLALIGIFCPFLLEK